MSLTKYTKAFVSLLLMLIFPLSVTSCHQNKQTTPAYYQLFTEPDAGRQPLLNAISHAKQEIDIVMYLFTDQRIAQALKNAAQRGIQVKLLLEKSPNQFEDANYGIAHFLEHTPNLSMQWVPYNDKINFFHEKAIIIDHHDAYVMTLNFTHSSFYKDVMERNFILEDQNPDDVNTMQHIFNSDWNHQKATLNAPTYIVLSPENSRAQLIQYIQAAHQSLAVYAIGLSDYELIGAFAKAAQQGVKVKILWDGKLNSKAAHYLKQHGVILKHIANNNENHAKLMIRDDQVLYIGSTNFTENSLDQNRELGIIVPAAAIAKEAKTVFIHDWNL